MEEREEIEPYESPSERRLSFPERLAAAAAGFGGAIARTAGAAGTLIADGDLRKRGTQVITNNASKGLRGIQHGIQTGASSIHRGLQTVQSGPRQLQSVLQRLSHQIEEQRMRILLEEEQDAPQDVQVGFQLYEDAPQELRSRLWMALLHHPELTERYQAILRAEAGDGQSEQIDIIGSTSGSAVELLQSEKPSTAQREPSEGNHLSTVNDSQTVAAPTATPSTTQQENLEQPAAPAAVDHRRSKGTQEEGEWEVVPDRGGQRWREGGHLLHGASFHRMEPWSAAREAYRQDIQAAMATLPWPLPIDHPEDSRYATLLQISIGQEETDDVISRDIHRTFPEHPLFAFEQGQQALFRVLKAYSLHDLEVGYCQGMAFVAGLLLFYVPEEPAFQVFCRLLAASGPNLRRHYLPGLHGLKIELCKFEWLLGKHMPNLRSHLEAHGAVPVLFASQWFLSAFSCPFPVSFACRLVDVMLVENSDAVLMRAALAVMAECEAELMMQDDFEELLTYLKVEPMSWGPHRLRRVLNAAVNSPVTAEELAEAEAAAEADDHLLLGTLRSPQEGGHGRGGVNSSDVSLSSERGATSAADVQGLEGIIGAEGSNREDMQRRHTSNRSLARRSTNEEEEEQEQEEGEEEGEDTAEADLLEHKAALDTAYLQMVLDLDQFVLDETSGEASEAYEHAMGAETEADRKGKEPPPSL